MKNEELNKYLAEFMGWFPGESIGYAPAWYFKKSANNIYETVIPISNWNPTEDLNQAFRCLEKQQSEYDWQLMYEYAEQDDIWFGQEYSCDIWPLKLVSKMISGRSNTPALAICQALYKTMEG
jgi:hypothetical protein